MARNQLEAQLEAIRTAKAVYKKEQEILTQKIEELTKEEKNILDQLKGRYI